jgi:hypothetical protein
MIQIINEICEKELSSFDGYYNFYNPLEDSYNNILKALEKAGMLPPINNHAYYMDGDNADIKNTAYRTWEKEK